jgi:hypothetical protein
VPSKVTCFGGLAMGGSEVNEATKRSAVFEFTRANANLRPSGDIAAPKSPRIAGGGEVIGCCSPVSTEMRRIASGAIALNIAATSPGSLAHEVLGMSSPFAPVGLNVRIFHDHIREAALQHHLSGTIVQSYAMAHEIGHVLLRSGSHGRQGVMSRVWTKREYDQMDHGMLVFSDDEAMIMPANLGAPACRQPDRRLPVGRGYSLSTDKGRAR